MKTLRNTLALLVIVACAAFALAGCSSSNETPQEVAHTAVEVEASCKGLTPSPAEEICEKEYTEKGQNGEQTKNREAQKKEADAEVEAIREGERIKREKPQEAHEVEEAIKEENG